MPTHGYSGTPLWKKLGIKPGQKIFIYDPPDDYRALLDGMPDGVNIVKTLRGKADLIHVFARRSAVLRKALERFRYKINEDGMIWVSWYKKAAGIPTDITEDTIRELCLPIGLVDVKVCAVDAQWSGLKLVIRRENRSKG